MATNKDSLSEKLLGGFAGTKNSLNTTKLAETIAQGISKRLSTIGVAGKFLGGKTVGKIDTALYTSVSEGQYQRLRRGDGVADVAAKLVNLIILSNEEKKLHHELDRNFEQEELDESKKIEEVGIEPVTVAEVDESENKKIFDSYNKLNLVNRIGKLWSWSKNVAIWVAKKIATYSIRALKFILPKTPLGRVVTGAIALGAVGYSVYEKLISTEGKGKKGLPGVAYESFEGGNKTIGVGHKITEKEKAQGFIQIGEEKVGLDQTLSESQMDLLLKQDVQTKALDPLQDALGSSWNKLNENQKQALTLYTYNVGNVKSLMKHGLKEAIDSGDTEAVASIIREHGITTVKGVPQEFLKKRRLEESILAEAPEEPNRKSLANIPDTAPGLKLNKESIDYNTMFEDEKTKQSMLVINNNNTIIQPVEGNKMSMISSTPQDYNLYELSTMVVYPE